eukprot:TRINITY_DN6110_c0_g2_i2.p1 TRINITY_DN6110_c0_g2~~TRINITY_DN6110_c0_g2_i2.p1  ORF type:complete len:120 (+),score=7.99 TRINITY_DN6110_c0_g2_i2:98-457(+)
MIRRPPRSTLSSSSAASDVYKRQPTLPAMQLMKYFQNANKKSYGNLEFFGENVIMCRFDPGHFVSFCVFCGLHELHGGKSTVYYLYIQLIKGQDQNKQKDKFLKSYKSHGQWLSTNVSS